MAEQAFNGDLAKFVSGCRKAGIPWRAIATELRDNHELAVSHETLRTWYGEPAEQAS